MAEHDVTTPIIPLPRLRRGSRPTGAARGAAPSDGLYLALFTDFSEIHGDRAFGDDPAISCGMAVFHGEL